MKPREFAYIGDTIPKIDWTENIDFILNMQNAMLLTLVERKLLTIYQMEQCFEEIQNQIYLENKKNET
jgi:hypothetical protein